MDTHIEDKHLSDKESNAYVQCIVQCICNSSILKKFLKKAIVKKGEVY